MTALISSALILVLKFVEWYLDHVKASKEAKESYLNFVKELGSHSKSCIRLRNDYLNQRDANLQKIKTRIKEL